MIVNREQDQCFGRGFNEGGTGGLLENFYDWVQRKPVDNPVSKSTGGPGWYVIEDNRTDLSNPYIIVSNHDASTVQNFPNSCYIYEGVNKVYPQDGSTSSLNPHKVFKVGYNTASPGNILFEAYTWYDTCASEYNNRYYSESIGTLDGAAFVYDFRGGPNFISLGTRRGFNWDFFQVGDWTGDDRYVESADKTAVLMESISTTDVSWSAGNDASVKVAVGESQNFTIDKYYYIYDASSGTQSTPWVNYVKILDKIETPSFDILHLDVSRYDFPTGSVLSPYLHRSYAWQRDYVSYNDAKIPYVSMKSTDNYWYQIAQENYIGVNFDFDSRFLHTMSPEEVRGYAVQRALICESASGHCNRVYGYPLGFYASDDDDLTQMLGGRIIDSTRYIYAASFSETYTLTLAFLLPDYDSTTA